MLSKQVHVRLVTPSGPSSTQTYVTLTPLKLSPSKCDTNPENQCDHDQIVIHAAKDANPFETDNSVTNGGSTRSVERRSLDTYERSRRRRKGDEDDADFFIPLPKSRCVPAADRKLRSSTSLRRLVHRTHIDSAIEPEADSILDFDDPPRVHTNVQQQSQVNGEVPSSSEQIVYQDDDIDLQLSQTTRTSPITLQWLCRNFEAADGVSLPRHVLYVHYLSHCRQNNIEPTNSASFGKLMRRVFLGLKTRRLGTRGNSKYHYYGIRMKADSELRHKVIDENPDEEAVASLSAENDRSENCPLHGRSYKNLDTAPYLDTVLPSQSGAESSASSDSNTEKASADAYSMPDVPRPDLQPNEASLHLIGLSVQQADRFFFVYRRHCEDLLDCVKAFAFEDVETCWRNFWQAEDFSMNSDLDADASESGYSSQVGMSRTQLFSLCTLPAVQEYIVNMDMQIYQLIINTLIPDVLQLVPDYLIQSIRSFAGSLEKGLALALQGAPDAIVKLKLSVVATLSQTLRRYTGLNWLASAARKVLQDSDKVSQMLADLNMITFRNIQEQAVWVCGCDSDFVISISKSFKTGLEKHLSLEQWGEWLANLVDESLCLGSQSIVNPMELIRSGKQFLLKWYFYCSIIMRDLTLTRPLSFGSLHLMRLLYDEYVFYLVEQRLCKVTGQTVLSIMSSTKTSLCGLHFGQYEYSSENNALIGMPMQVNGDMAVEPTRIVSIPDYEQPNLHYTNSLTENGCRTTDENGRPLGTDSQQEALVEEFFVTAVNRDETRVAAPLAYDFDPCSASGQSENDSAESSNPIGQTQSRPFLRPIESCDFEPESPERAIITNIVSNGHVVNGSGV